MDVAEVSAEDDVVTKEGSDKQGPRTKRTKDNGVFEIEMEREAKKEEKPRVTYSKEDLLNLRESPASKLWPSILSDTHVRHGVWDPEAWHLSMSSRRTSSPAEELKRQLLVVEDGIVLSPQRQSFGQGCQIPQSAPGRAVQQERTKSGVSRTTDREREGRSRLTGRVGRGRTLDYKERTLLQEKSLEPDGPSGGRLSLIERERDGRGTKGRERPSEKGYRELKKGKEESSKGRNIQVHKKNTSRTEEEPEWFTFGPSSQFETMELKGFDEKESAALIRDRERRRSVSDEIKAILSVGKEAVLNGEVESAPPAISNSSSQDISNKENKANEDKAETKPFDINQFFLSETLLPFSAGIDQGNSRFCQFFGKPGSNYSSSISGSTGISSGGTNTPRTPSPGPSYFFTPIAPSGDENIGSESLAHVLGQKVNVQPLLDEVMSTGQENAKIRGSIRLEDIETEVRKDKLLPEEDPLEYERNKENFEKVGDGVCGPTGDMLAFNMLVEKMKSSGTLPEKPQPAISGLPTHLLPRPPSPKRKTPRRSPSPLLDYRRSPSPAELLQQLTMQAPLSDPRPPSPAQVVPQMSRSYSPLEMFHKFNAIAVSPPRDVFGSPLLRRSPSPLAMLAQQRKQSPPLGFSSSYLRRMSPQSKPLFQTVPQPTIPPRGQQFSRKPSERRAGPGETCEANKSEFSPIKPVSTQSGTPHIIDRSFMPTSVIRKIHQERLAAKPESGEKLRDQDQGKVGALTDSAGTAANKSSLVSDGHRDTDQEQCTYHISAGTPTRHSGIGSSSQPLVGSQSENAEKGQLLHQVSAENLLLSPTTLNQEQLLSPRSVFPNEKQILNLDSPVLQKPTAFKPLPGSPPFPFSGGLTHSEPPSPYHSLMQTRPNKGMPNSAPCTPQRPSMVNKAALLSPQQLVSRGQLSREEPTKQLVGTIGQNTSLLESQMQTLQNGLTQVVAARDGRPLSHPHEQKVPVTNNKGIAPERVSHAKRNESLSSMLGVPHHTPNRVGVHRMNSSDASARHDNIPPNFHLRMHGDSRPISAHHIPRQFLGSPGSRPGFHLPNGRVSPPVMPAAHGHPGRTPFNSPMSGMALPPRAAMHPGMMQPPVHPAYMRMMPSSGPPLGMRPPNVRIPGPPHSAGRYPMMLGQTPMMYGGRPSPGYPAMSPAAMMAARSPHMHSVSALQQLHARHAPSPVMNHPPPSLSPGGGSGNVLSKWFSEDVLQQATPVQRSAAGDFASKVMSVEELERQQAAAIN